jgi:hypothetical protein
MPEQRIPILSIGESAWRIIAKPQPATFHGKTSVGIFLLLPDGWVIFITNTPSCGPLTINIPGFPGTVRLRNGTEITIQDHWLFFPNGMTLALDGSTKIWEPSHPGNHPSTLAADHLQTVFEFIQSVTFDLSLESWDDHMACLASLRQASLSGETPRLVELLTEWIGRGSGLTPQGDDILTGYLLALNRYPLLAPASSDLPAIFERVCRSAWENTTSLSASLIACAAAGLADERLVDALDALIAEDSALPGALHALATYGSSSGTAALLGMILAMLASPICSESTYNWAMRTVYEY